MHSQNPVKHRLLLQKHGFSAAFRAGFFVAWLLGISAIVLTVPALASAVTPTVKGTKVEGSLVYSSYSATRYRWLRCSATGGSCVQIPNATLSKYRLTASDVGRRIRVRITRVGVTTTSAATVRILPKLPVATTLPAIGGYLQPGLDATTTRGVWAPGGRTYTYVYAWQRCSSPGVCAAITGATSNTYTPDTVLDPGNLLRTKIIATAHLKGMTRSASAYSAYTGAIPEPAAPENLVTPAITGNAVETALLTGNAGTFDGPGTITYAYEWQLCDAQGAGCIPIVGADSSEYTPVIGDVGSTLVFSVSATNDWGTTVTASPPTAVVAPDEPVNTVLPTVTGVALYTGGTAGASSGTWTGLNPKTYTYQWQRCDELGESCVDIAGQTATTHTVVADDAGGTLRLVVTATNSADLVGVTATSEASVLIGASPAPESRELPTISGMLRDGSLLTAVAGLFVGQAPITHAYKWQRCDVLGENCINITGATAATYRLVTADVYKTIRLVDTATNGAGSASVTSEQSATIDPVLPTNTTLPSISIITTLTDGKLLGALNGTWIGTATITYTTEWLQCNTLGEECEVIAGQTSGAFVLGSDQVGKKIRLRITATNTAGTVQATSAATATVLPRAPVGVAGQLPLISGTAAVGQELSTSNGGWLGSPDDFSYQWLRCTGASCVSISGTNSTTYTLIAADLGKTIQVRVTAHNSAGSGSATSAASSTIIEVPVAPALTALPTITGTARQGLQLVAHAATFSGTAYIAHAFSWESCNSDGSGCEPIDGESGTTFLPGVGEIGRKIRVIDTGTNSAGGASGTSSMTSAVLESFAPEISNDPSIDGALEHGAQLTALPGTWNGTPPITYSYKWQRCSLDGVTCADIPGAGAVHYTLTAQDVGAAVKLLVHASSPFGSADMASDVSSEVAPARIPVNSGSPPSISGDTERTRPLSINKGTWTGTAMNHTYQWQRCNQYGESCVNITNATSTTYTLGSLDVGKTLRNRVVATNPAALEGVVAISAETAVIIEATPPAYTVAPFLESGPNFTSYVVNNGEWTGTKTIAYMYQWQRCTSSSAATCSNHGALTPSKSYSFTGADIGYWFRAIARATNPVANAANAVIAPPTEIWGPISDIELPENAGVVDEDDSLLPRVIGTTIQGKTVLGDKGTWYGGGAMSFAYQWKLCDIDGLNCGDLAGKTSNSLPLTLAHVDGTLKFCVVATNPAGPSGQVCSLASDIVEAWVEPQNVGSPPWITNSSEAGAPRIGNVLTAHSGDWIGTPSLVYKYTWLRCDLAGANCVDITEPLTSTNYKVVLADLASTIRVRVTVSNVTPAEVSAESEQTDEVIEAIAPENTVLPTVPVAPARTGTQTANAGTWIGSKPFLHQYQWQRCTSIEIDSCSDITGANDQSYVPVVLDVDNFLRVVVTTSNGGGEQVAISNLSENAVTPGSIPSNTSAPSVSGPQVVGQVVSVSLGTWVGTGSISYSYQWQRCDAEGEDCHDIAGKTSSQYTLVGADLSFTVRIRVRGHNLVGVSEFVDAAAVGPIAS